MSLCCFGSICDHHHSNARTPFAPSRPHALTPPTLLTPPRPPVPHTVPSTPARKPSPPASRSTPHATALLTPPTPAPSRRPFCPRV